MAVKELLNKVEYIFVFFAHKKYSRSFTKLKLKLKFLDLGTLQLRCCLWRLRGLSDYIKNIWICVPKMNEGLGTTWRWVINDRIFILGWANPLTLCMLISIFFFKSNLLNSTIQYIWLLYIQYHWILLYKYNSRYYTTTTFLLWFDIYCFYGLSTHRFTQDMGNVTRSTPVWMETPCWRL